MYYSQESKRAALGPAQPLTEIGVEKNTTVVFPLPIDIITVWVKSIASAK